MRLIKMFGLAAVAAVAAMAFVGASSAMAANTSLCKVNENPCAEANRAKSVHMVAGTTVLKTSLATILCLSSLVEGPVEGTGLGAPLGIEITLLHWNNCGTNAAHTNCTVTNLKLPLFDVLNNTSPPNGLGTAIALGAEVLVECPGLGIHCIYGGVEVPGFSVESALHNEGAAGHGMFTATELLVPKVKGGFFCPEKSFWTALYEPLEHLWLSS